MKTAILQYYIGAGEVPGYVKISSSKFKQYADMHGCDYIFDTTSKLNPTNPFFEHLRILQDPEFEKYDRVLFIDVDIIPEVLTENIFDEEIKDIGAVPEFTPKGRLSRAGHDFPHKHKAFKAACASFNIPVVQPKTVTCETLIFNSGVLLWSREGIIKAKNTFLHWPEWNNRFIGQMSLDQPYMTGQIVKHLDYTELDYKWNSHPRMKFAEKDVPKNMNFVHYTGKKKTLITELYNA